MKIRWTAKAVDDLQSLRKYIDRDKSGAAKKLVERIILTVEGELVLQPGMGRPGRRPGTKEFVVIGTPYFLPYRVAGEYLEILRVLHGARQWS